MRYAFWFATWSFMWHVVQWLGMEVMLAASPTAVECIGKASVR